MKCDELEMILADYFEGELDEARADDLLDHVERCEACRAEFRAYEQQEERLRRYFKVELEKAQLDKAPILELTEAETGTPARVFEIAPAPWRRRWDLAAAAALILFLIGVGGWTVYRRVVPTGQAVVATVKEAHGRVLASRLGAFHYVEQGMPIHQNEKLKVASDGYLALELPNHNVVEARGGTQLSVCNFPDRTEVDMNRGSVWAHLKTPHALPLVVRTAHLTAKDVGTVFGVEEGLDRSTVLVAEGEVLVESGGAQRLVAASQSFSSRADAQLDSVLASTSWSHYRKELESLLSGAKENAQPSVPQLQAGSAALASAFPETPAAATAASQSQISNLKSQIGDLADVLPDDTLYLLEIRDWQGLIGEFGRTDYSALLNEPAMRQWWEAIGGRKTLDDFLGETRLLDTLKLLSLFDGQLILSAGTKGDVLFLADCGRNEAQISSLLDTLEKDNGPVSVASQAPLTIPNPQSATGESTIRNPQSAIIVGGRFVFSPNPGLAQATANRIAGGQTTTFATSGFYSKLMADVANPRFIMAANLGGQIENVINEVAKTSNAKDMDAMLDLLGLPSLDYFLLSPSFAGRGMNQAARLAFVSQGRYGAMNWLAEPGPMRSIDFFSPDIHLFASAIIRKPDQMLLDYLAYLEATRPEKDFKDAIDFVAKHQAFFASFGGDLAIGVDSPILPIPSVKIAIEVVDQDAFRKGLDALIAELKAKLSENGKMSAIETTTYNDIAIYSFVIDSVPITPAWAFVDDYFIAGPGPRFVCDSIEIHKSGHSIANDSRLVSLLPSGTEMNFSLLVYQDIARSIPEIVREKIEANLKDESKRLVPDLSFLGQYRAAGIAYAYARPECIDFYLKAPTGIDLNMGMAVPMIANWLAPRTGIGQTVSKLAETQVALEELQAAVEKFQTANGRLPKSLDEIATADGKYVAHIPADPFAVTRGENLRLVTGPGENEITIYSVGPDGVDDGGTKAYNLMEKYDGPGDVLARIPAKTATTAAK